MASLPPYSTYRTDNKHMIYPQAISHGNVLTFTPPGFKHTLNVKFPDSRLAVCEKCKKNYKTRDMCRVRNSHTAAPWATAYICITLDDSCTDADGKYVDTPLTVRMVQWQPFCVKEPFDPKTPVCSACKKTNRTRTFCRERHRHRNLPWCTVYVLLSTVDSIDPSTAVAAPSTPIVGGGVPTSSLVAQEEISVPTAGADIKVEVTKGSDDNGAASFDGDKQKKQKAKKAKGGDDNGEGDDINDIADSRTFLVKVSCKAISIHWLELSEFDPSEQFTGLIAPPDSHVHKQPPEVPAASEAQEQPQYYGSHGYPPTTDMRHSQQYSFYQMQQHQQYAASHRAWQEQYNQGHIHHHHIHPPPDQPPYQPPPPGIPSEQPAPQIQEHHQQPNSAPAAAPLNPPPPPPPSGTNAAPPEEAAQHHQQPPASHAPPPDSRHHQALHPGYYHHQQPPQGPYPGYYAHYQPPPPQTATQYPSGDGQHQQSQQQPPPPPQDESVPPPPPLQQQHPIGDARNHPQSHQEVPVEQVSQTTSNSSTTVRNDEAVSSAAPASSSADSVRNEDADETPAKRARFSSDT